MSTRLSFSCMVGFCFELHVSVSVVYRAHGYACAVSSDQGHCGPSLPLLWKGATIMITATANCLYISVDNCKGLYDIILYHPPSYSAAHINFIHWTIIYDWTMCGYLRHFGSTTSISCKLYAYTKTPHLLWRVQSCGGVTILPCLPGPLAHCVYKLAAAPQTTAGSAIYYTIL